MVEAERLEQLVVQEAVVVIKVMLVVLHRVVLIFMHMLGEKLEMIVVLVVVEHQQ